MLLSSKMHTLQPKHSKIKEEEVKLLLKKYNLSKSQLPKISHSDSALLSLKDIKTDDVIKIERKDSKSPYYRIVA